MGEQDEEELKGPERGAKHEPADLQTIKEVKDSSNYGGKYVCVRCSEKYRTSMKARQHENDEDHKLWTLGYDIPDDWNNA